MTNRPFKPSKAAVAAYAALNAAKKKLRRVELMVLDAVIRTDTEVLGAELVVARNLVTRAEKRVARFEGTLRQVDIRTLVDLRVRRA